MSTPPPLWAKIFAITILVLLCALLIGALIWANIALWSHIR